MSAQQQPPTAVPVTKDSSIAGDDLPKSFTPPTVARDYTKRVEMVPMRDGTKLYTEIYVPAGAQDLPILLTRTPYNAAAHARGEFPHLIDTLPLADENFVRAGYIRVYQDVRGKYGSEGAYLMTPPPVNSGFNPTGADDTSDGYDTIDWLVKHLPESNGRVGMIGSSYEGFTVVMQLLHPHPALKVAVPESPMIDGWMGDDWFHFGAFRQPNIDYVLGQTSTRGRGVHESHEQRDDYSGLLKAGNADAFAQSLGMSQLPYWQTLVAHPAYDKYWQAQALDKLIAKVPLTVPTMWEQGEWDQEDMWGAIHAFRAWEPEDKHNTMNHLVMGPWFHSQINRQGRALGPLVFDTDTAEQWRRDVLVPFMNEYLKPGAPKTNIPKVWMYNTGTNQWDTYAKWPQSCEQGCPAATKPLYLTAQGSLSFEKPATAESSGEGVAFREYVSDPANPVPYRPRPVDAGDPTGWRTWLVTDQRFVDGRPDVLTYVSDPLTSPMKLAGEPVVHLDASTSGTDADWVVKIIDVYPDRPDTLGDNSGVFPGVLGTSINMSGYELPLATDIFRGRYRTSFEHPEPIKPGIPLEYSFVLPQINRTIPVGHRLMVQIQSTLFPLYDRNPQTFVPNIFVAPQSAYKKATERVWSSVGNASYISLPVR
ncbi:MAG: CocE/NonD family hydrolase [Janthinobacterium lividum]